MTRAMCAGDTQALYVLTKFHQQRFEFIFTNLQKTMGHLFNVVQAVYKAYDNSRLYRDIKLRGRYCRCTHAWCPYSQRKLLHAV